MPDDALEALADPDAPDCFDLPGFCLPCGRRLADREPYTAEPDRPGHWDGPMPLSVKAGIAWWVVVPAGLATLMIAAVDWLVH